MGQTKRALWVEYDKWSASLWSGVVLDGEKLSTQEKLCPFARGQWVGGCSCPTDFQGIVSPAALREIKGAL